MYEMISETDRRLIADHNNSSLCLSFLNTVLSMYFEWNNTIVYAVETCLFDSPKPRPGRPGYYAALRMQSERSQFGLDAHGISVRVTQFGRRQKSVAIAVTESSRVRANSPPGKKQTVFDPSSGATPICQWRV